MQPFQIVDIAELDIGIATFHIDIDIAGVYISIATFHIDIDMDTDIDACRS